MTRFLGVLAGLSIATMVAGSTADAQMVDNARPVTIGLAGGLSMPLGDFGDSFKSGYNVTGSIGFRPAAIPFGIRAEVGYQSFDADGFDITLSTLYGTANAVFNLGAGGTGIAPYVIGGVGMYNVDADMGDSETEFGFNGGAGLRFALSGFNTFLEARYHHVLTEGDAMTFVPITFGVEF